MPKKTQKKTAKRAETDWQTEVLLLGYCIKPNGEKDFRRGKGLMFGEPPLPDWENVEAELLPDFIEEHPCSRPWGWWREAAPEPRRRVGGTGRRERRASLEFGVPHSTWFKDVDGSDPPLYESQASYLLRLNILIPEEKKWLADHPEALKPEAIKYHLALGPEAYPVGYSGPGYYEDREDI